MEIYWIIILSITVIFIALIQMAGKERRIKLMRDMSPNKIKAVGEYEHKSNLRSKFKNYLLIQFLLSLFE